MRVATTTQRPAVISRSAYLSAVVKRSEWRSETREWVGSVTAQRTLSRYTATTMMKSAADGLSVFFAEEPLKRFRETHLFSGSHSVSYWDMV